MSSENIFRSRVSQLEEEVSKLENGLGTKKSKLNFVIYITIPVFVFTGLWKISPWFVMTKKSHRMFKDGGKIFLWTIIFSLIIYLSAFIYNRFYKRENSYYIFNG